MLVQHNGVSQLKCAGVWPRVVGSFWWRWSQY
jgi:hypothetical protein